MHAHCERSVRDDNVVPIPWSAMASPLSSRVSGEHFFDDCGSSLHECLSECSYLMWGDFHLHESNFLLGHVRLPVVGGESDASQSEAPYMGSFPWNTLCSSLCEVNNHATGMLSSFVLRL